MKQDAQNHAVCSKKDLLRLNQDHLLVTEIGALFFLGKRIPCEDMRHLEMFYND